MSRPTPGHAITMRVAAPAGFSATSELTAAAASAGAEITALDVIESTHENLVVDITCNTSGEDHAEQVAAAVDALDGVQVRKVSDRTFLMHLGGKLVGRAEGRPAQPGRSLPRVHPRRGPGVPGHRRQSGRRPPADHQAQHRRRRHRRDRGAGPGQHRPGRRAAGDGGQGRAVQAVRQRRRLAGLPGHHRTPRRSS